MSERLFSLFRGSIYQQCALYTASLPDEDFNFDNHKVCKLLVDDSNNKNPRDHEGITPLHLPSKGEHLEAFHYIFDQVDEKKSYGYLWPHST